MSPGLQALVLAVACLMFIVAAVGERVRPEHRYFGFVGAGLALWVLVPLVAAVKAM